MAGGRLTSSSSSRKKAWAASRAVTLRGPARASGSNGSLESAGLKVGTNVGRIREWLRFQRRRPDEGLAPHEEAPPNGRPGAESVEERRVLDQVQCGGHQAGRLERLAAVGLPADRGEIDELRLTPGVVPPREPALVVPRSRAHPVKPRLL